MFYYVLFNVPLLFFIILSLTAKLPKGQLVIWKKSLQEDVYEKKLQEVHTYQ